MRKGYDANRRLTLLEAALYVAGRPLSREELANFLGTDPREVVWLVRRLSKRYSELSSALEVAELPDGRYAIQLKPEHLGEVKGFAKRPLLTPGPLRTLSYVAFNQPTTQAKVVRARGKLAYRHVKELKRLGLIADEKCGRTRMLRTTNLFADLFNLSRDVRAMKRQLSKLIKAMGQDADKTLSQSG